MGTLVLRRGLPRDCDPAVSVWRAASTARRGGRPPSPERDAQVDAQVREPDALLVVADDAGAVVGMAVGVQGLEDDGTGPPSAGLCFVSMVYVAPDRWGEGIGGRTVDALLAEARSCGYDRAQLWTRADNRRARRLYEGRGFRLAGREAADADGERIVLHERRLGDDDVAEASDGSLAVTPRAASQTRPHDR